MNHSVTQFQLINQYFLDANNKSIAIMNRHHQDQKLSSQIIIIIIILIHQPSTTLSSRTKK